MKLNRKGEKWNNPMIFTGKAKSSGVTPEKSPWSGLRRMQRVATKTVHFRGSRFTLLWSRRHIGRDRQSSR
jgi:hypothetical protein